MIDIRTVNCHGCNCKVESNQGVTISFKYSWKNDIRLCDNCAKSFAEKLTGWVAENIGSVAE